MEIRYYGDKISERIAKTPEGFLICQDVPISRTGYQEYLASELMDNPINKHKIIPVYRPAKEVFDPRSLASFEGKPVTNEHPDEDVTPENYQRYSCGHVQNVHVGDGEDSNKVLADLYITDPTLIRLIEDGKREISCGYYAEEKKDDTGKICQIKIRGNHVAVVRNGRAGKTVCIRDKHPYKGKKGFNRFKEENLMSHFRNEHLIGDDLFDDDYEILDDAYEYFDEDNFEDDDALFEDEDAYLDTFYKDYGVKGMQKGKHVKASDPDYLAQIKGGGGTKRTTQVAVKKPGMSTGKKAAIAAGVGAAALGGALLARKYGLGKKLGSGLSKAFGKKKASPLDKIKGVFGKKKKPSAFDRFKSAFRKKKSAPPQSDRLLSAKIRAASMKNSANKALNSAKNYGNDKLLSGRIRASSMANSAKNLAKTARYNARNMAESAKRFGSDKLLSAKISLAAKRKGLDSMPYYKKRLHYYDDFDLEDDDPILEDEDFLEDDDVILEDEDEFVDEDYLEDEDEFIDEDELMEDEDYLEDDDDYIEDDEEDVVVDDDYLEDEDELVDDEDEFVEDEEELMEDEDYLEDEDDLMEDDEDVVIEDEDDLSEQATNVLRDAKSILRDARAHLNRMKKRDAIILNDDDLEETYDDEEELLEDDEDYLEDEGDLMEDDEDVIVDDDDLENSDCLEDDDEIFEEEADVVEDDEDEFVEDEDELMEDDEDIIVEDGCHKDGAIDTDKAQALREITEASRSITDPNERKQLQDAIYKALCGRNQMQDVMRITKRNMKSRMDSAAKKNSKVDLTQQQSIYDSLNPHKKTSF